MVPPTVFTIRRFHESTRRRWCRFALGCFAFLPLMLLVGVSILVATPWYRAMEKREWERKVGGTLGIDIQAKEFRWTAPSQFRAEGVEVRHPETHHLLGRVERIDGLMKPQGWSVILESPSIDGEQLDRGLDVVHDWFLCRPQTSSQLLALSIPRGIAIHHGTQKTSLNRIDIVFRPASTVSSIHAKWTFEEQPFGEVALHVSREHASEDATTKMEISSPAVWVPCSLATDRYRSWNWLGEGARFRGVVQYQGTRRSWDALVSGEIQNVDFGGMTNSLGSPILGRGALEFEQLHLRDRRILKAAGEFRVQAGTASRRWLQHVAESLRLQVSFPQESPDALAMEQVGLRFALDPSGISLKGTLPGPSHWPPIAARLGDSFLFADGTVSPLSQLIQALQYGPQANGLGAIVIEGASPPVSAYLPVPAPTSDRRGSAAAAAVSRNRLSRAGSPSPR